MSQRGSPKYDEQFQAEEWFCHYPGLGSSYLHASIIPVGTW